MSKQRAYVLIGLPGSGKSTWTVKQMEKMNPRGIGVVSRDAIRLMLNGNYKYIEEQQDLITRIAIESSKAILDRGNDLIIDQANINRETRKEVTDFLHAVDSDIEIWFVYLYVDETQSLVNRRVRGDSRGYAPGYHKNVIEKMKNKFEPISFKEDYDVRLNIGAYGQIIDERIKPRVESKKKVEKEIPMEELWNLHHTFAKFIYPRLVKFRKYHCGAAGGHEYKNGHRRYSEKYGSKGDKELYLIRWDEMLDRMIRAFELWLSQDDWDCEYDSKEHKKRWHQIEEGFNLFIKYFNGLWW